MKKVLIVCSVSSMIEQFNLNNIKILKKIGYEVFVASNFIESGNIPNKKSKILKENLINDGVKVFDIPFTRRPLSFRNIKTLRNLINLIKENNFTIIHAQSPIGGVLTRIANVAARNSPAKLIYTAHGFHFYKGAPLLNWLIYFPLEYILSFFTDLLITINEEDYQRSKGLKAKDIRKIPGVGVEIECFQDTHQAKEISREKMGFKQDDFVICSVGELNKNKNHIAIIEALRLLKNPKIYYIICGIGIEKEYLQNKINEYKLNNQVQLLGYRKDINELLSISNVFAFPSKREGLGLSAIEAMAAGLPLITSNVHGINDYSKNEITGFKTEPENYEGFAINIQNIIDLTKEEIDKISVNNKRESRMYSSKIVNAMMEDIYKAIGK